MKCDKCNSDRANTTRWGEVLIDGKYCSIGGNAGNLQSKHSYANSMKNGSYGRYTEKDIKVREYNHCFNCGYANKETIITY